MSKDGRCAHHSVMHPGCDSAGINKQPYDSAHRSISPPTGNSARLQRGSGKTDTAGYHPLRLWVSDILIHPWAVPIHGRPWLSYPDAAASLYRTSPDSLASQTP